MKKMKISEENASEVCENINKQCFGIKYKSSLTRSLVCTRLLGSNSAWGGYFVIPYENDGIYRGCVQKNDVTSLKLINIYDTAFLVFV